MAIFGYACRLSLSILFFLFIKPDLFSQPAILSFSPLSGPVGTTVTINGSNFNSVAANNIVYFGAVKAMVTAATTNSLTVTVPSGATYEPVSVSTNGLTAYSALPFIVTFPGGGDITPYAFEARIDLAAGESPYDLASGDLDGDGKPDMVAVNGGYPYSISIYRNTGTSGTISFAAKIDYPTGIVPTSAAISDIDGDGKLDIVVTNEYSFTVSVFRNISTFGNIAFAARVDLPAHNPDGIAIGDLNKDGKPDLAVTNFVANSVSIFRNTSVPGTISFAASTEYPTGQYPSGISIGDLDGNTWPDIIISNDNSSFLSIFKNNAIAGSISLTSINNLITGVDAKKVILTDIDGDNKLDIGVTKGISGISVYRNISNAGNLAFSTNLDFTTVDYPIALSAADLDGDGKPDLTVTGGTDLISVLKNTSSSGLISFKSNVNFLIGQSPYMVSIADFDGDNKPDLATPNQSDNKVSVLRNKVDGPDIISFSPASATAGTTITITGAKFIGITDVRFGGVPAQSFTVVSPSSIQAVVSTGASGEVSVTGSKGTGRAQGFIFLYPTLPPPAITSFTPASGPVGTTVTITGNNFDNSPSQNIVYFGATRATVLSASATSLTVQVPVGATYEPITVSTNALTASATVPFVVTFQEGPAFTSGSFDDPQVVDQNSNYQLANRITDADIDGDGKTDLIYGRDAYFVARNIGTANSIAFASSQKIIDDHLGYYLVEPGDIDGDGKIDLVKVNDNASYNGAFSVLKNTSTAGNISFVPGVSYPNVNSVFSFAIKDLDLDGKPDLIMPVRNGDSMTIYRNTTNGPAIQFALLSGVITGDDPVHVSCGDLDGDGKPEVVIANNAPNSISIFPNTSSPGAISFGSKVNYTAYGGPVGTTLADFDLDGKLDIAVVSDGAFITIFKNTSTLGSISFTQATSFYTYSFPSQIRSADMNGDGKPELIAFSERMYSISVFKNVSNATAISFGLNVSYTYSNIYKEIYGEQEVADFNGDGKPDMVVGADNRGIGILKNTVSTARTVPAGANPVKGEIIKRMTVDQTVNTYNGIPYVQRHYDAEPLTDPATSTATVTLYFTQQDFDNFNAVPNHGPNLPTNSNDASGVANLRVYQYHGFSATSLPGSYSGVGTEINPDDANIGWNVKASCWEVIFNVTGFSGFFVSNASFNSILPPVITAGGATGFCQGGNVILTSSATNNNQWYKDGVIINGANSPTFQATTSGVYSVNTTVNGVASLASNNIIVTAAPPPAQPVISSDGATLTSSSASGNQWYREGIAITGAIYQTYKPLDAANYSVTVTSNGCTGPASVNYYYMPAPVITTDPGTVFCQGFTKTLTSSALTNNQWYKNGVIITGATSRTYVASQSGNYTATTSDNKGTSAPSNTILITVIPGPPKPTITVNGDLLVSSAAVGNEWYKDGNIIQGATGKTYKPVSSGNYSVFARDPATFCTTESDKFYFAITGVINIDNTHFVKLSPNPVKSKLVLNYNLAGTITVNCQIIDINGRICGTFNNLSNGSELDLSGFSFGTYLAKIIDPVSKKNYVIKLMKL
jgi:hypothetical protein